MTKTCMQCGGMFHKRSGEGGLRWEARKFCSRPCWAEFRSIAAGGQEQKACANCGAVFIRRNSRHTEAMWTAKKYCSRDCYQAHHRGERHHLWQGGRSLDRGRRERYGISGEQFQEMRGRQDGVCAVCLDRDATCVDHDHGTGQVRALLCRQCNAALGLFRDDPDLLERAAEYVRTHSRASLVIGG